MPGIRFSLSKGELMKPLTIAALCLTVFIWPAVGSANTLTFGVTPQRTGWDSSETVLTPANVRSIVHRWDSVRFATASIGGKTYAPHVYGSPLEIDAVPIRTGLYAGKTLSLILAATTNGDAYAVNAIAQPSVAAGAVVWHTHLGLPGIENFDGGMPLGVESTGIVDPLSGRWYLTNHVTKVGWTAVALDLGSGSVLPGWPVLLSSNVAPSDTNGSPGWGNGLSHAQRSALSLSLDARTLYVPMGTYGDDVSGWLVAIDTAGARIVSSWSATNSSAIPGAGLWTAGGAATSTNGMLYTTTGNAAAALTSSAGVWGQTFVAFAQDQPLNMIASYTPWNLNSLEAMDGDVGGSGVMLPPDLTVTGTTTPHVAVFGSKQGVVYMLDLDHLPGGNVIRQPAASAALDGSLMPPGANTPLAVFGPYCDYPCQNNGDYAKMRTTPAYFASAGQAYVYVTGMPKSAVNSATTVAPCLVWLRIVTPAGQPAYLALDAANMTIACLSPGSPVIVGQVTPLVWVYDANINRHASMIAGPRPILRAFDASSMQELWESPAGSLDSGGKYMLPIVTHGLVVVATDRIQVFSL